MYKRQAVDGGEHQAHEGADEDQRGNTDPARAGIMRGDHPGDSKIGASGLIMSILGGALLTPLQEMCIRDSSSTLLLLSVADYDGLTSALNAETPGMASGLATDYQAVSYTHLDVYKRQGIYSP